MIYNRNKKTSPAGLRLVQNSEGKRLKAYKCPAGVWTIGYGHTGPEVKEGLVWTDAQATTALLKDLEKCENTVKAYVNKELTQGQFDALVDFIFNLGRGCFVESSILQRINTGKLNEVPSRLRLYVKAGSPLRTLPGLVTRREAEVKLWNS